MSDTLAGVPEVAHAMGPPHTFAPNLMQVDFAFKPTEAQLAGAHKLPAS